jgi:L-ascorbate metabolism protein UlaG (beta-lactamase superfamily)
MSTPEHSAGIWPSHRCALLWSAALALGLFGLGQTTAAAQQERQALSQEPACQSMTPAAAGGAMPINPDVIVLRWLGHTNYELAYRGSVVLLDAYYERIPGNHAIGVAPDDLTRANAILLGHAHFDHISDAAAIATQTGAVVVGASFSSDLVRTQGVPDEQVTTVTGTETEPIEFGGFTVLPVLGQHEDMAALVPPGYWEAADAAIEAVSLVPALTAVEQERAAMIRARGSNATAIATRGTIGYLLTFENQYRLLFVDSPGPITPAQQQLAQTLSGVDLALLPFVGRDVGIAPLVELTRLFKPGVVLLGHHDGPGLAKWSSIVPPALEMRSAVPGTLTPEPVYRAPVCINTATKDVFIGR